ncbi:MAG TPA: DUF1801 domain-containing protein [Candidatus Dojkabacteria bacterium]|nr:DUF1801 domain-containing protein [Candidatus Dojkabacteria bacterium]
MMNKKAAKNVDEYIKGYPEDIQIVAKKLRKLIKDNAPEAKEMISYAIPLYKMNGKHLVAFAIYKKHYGFYPTKSEIFKVYEKELEGYKKSVGTIQFPINKPLPFDLIKKIVKFRVEENERDTMGSYK